MGSQCLRETAEQTCGTLSAAFLPAVRPLGRTGGVAGPAVRTAGLFFCSRVRRASLLGVEPVRVAVFIDWQNVLLAARRAFGMQRFPTWQANFSPLRLARLLAAAKNRGSDGRLVAVEIFRGHPSPTHDPVGFAANRRQSAAWRAEAPAIVSPRTRPLRYPRSFPAEPPVEKGIDVEFAVAAVSAVLRGSCDVAIVFSHDSDLLPVPEAITKLAGPGHVETAAWTSPTFRQRLNPKAPVKHHAIPKIVFDSVSTPVNYAVKP